MEFHNQMIKLSIEIGSLKKAKRTDEQRIGLKITGEYENLVQELSTQLIVLKGRFEEYKSKTVSVNEISQRMYLKLYQMQGKVISKDY
jgi:hypothetical protein